MLAHISKVLNSIGYHVAQLAVMLACPFMQIGNRNQEKEE